MSRALEQLEAALSGLPTPDRAALAQYLLRSPEPEEEGATIEWLALAEQRMAEARAGQVVGIPAEDVPKSLPEPGAEAGRFPPRPMKTGPVLDIWPAVPTPFSWERGRSAA